MRRRGGRDVLSAELGVELRGHLEDEGIDEDVRIDEDVLFRRERAASGDEHPLQHGYSVRVAFWDREGEQSEILHVVANRRGIGEDDRLDLVRLLVQLKQQERVLELL